MKILEYVQKNNPNFYIHETCKVCKYLQHSMKISKNDLEKKAS